MEAIETSPTLVTLGTWSRRNGIPMDQGLQIGGGSDRDSAARSLRADIDDAAVRRGAPADGQYRERRARACGCVSDLRPVFPRAGVSDRLRFGHRVLRLHVAARALLGDAGRDPQLRQPGNCGPPGLAVCRRGADDADRAGDGADPVRGPATQVGIDSTKCQDTRADLRRARARHGEPQSIDKLPIELVIVHYQLPI